MAAATAASELPKLYQGVQKQSFGYKMLATMGWKEGQGLVSEPAQTAAVCP
jgi:Pin2-interacting protein X1